jgi:hypothetical protein
MSDFELQIKNDIEPTAWIEKYPFNKEQLCRVLLHIDWEKRTAEVRVQRENSTDHRVQMHLASQYELSAKIDASKFKEYYDSNIKHLILAMSKNFKVYWDDDSWKGMFGCSDVEEDELGIIDNVDSDYGIEHKIKGDPTHDVHVYFDVDKSIEDYKDFIDTLNYAYIDFMTADLNDMAVVKKIRKYVEDGIVYAMSDDEFKGSLIRMRELIVE